MGVERDWEVREARQGDGESIGSFLHAIWDEAGPDAPGFAGATSELIDELARPDAVHSRLGGPTRRMMIAIRDDEVIGFAATRSVSADEIELAGIVVRRVWAGRGIGRELVREALDVSRRHGAVSMIVRTEVDNVAAIGFYESLGFRRTREDVEMVDDVSVAVVELSRRI